MLPKQIKNYPSGNNPHEGFRARVKYACDKATTVTLINVTGDWESAAQQMAKGYVQATDIEPVIGALLTIGSVVWSVADKRVR